MADPISPEQLKGLDIKSLALNKDKLGSLTFDKSHPFLEKIRDLFVELNDLGYADILTEEERNQVLERQTRFTEFLDRLSQFDPALGNVNKDIRDNFDAEIERFYNEAQRQLRGSLTYLRQESTLKSQDAQVLKEQSKQAAQARKQYEEMRAELEKELHALKEQKQKVESTHGELAATRFGKFFENQAVEYNTSSDKWINSRSIMFRWLIGVIIINVALYLILFVTDKINWWPHIKPTDFFTVEYGVVKLALLSILSYAIAFTSRNYYVTSHLCAVNKHRKNIADTLNEFLATNPDEKTRSQLVHQATEAMFKSLPIGYLREQKDSGPIYEVINKVLPGNKE